MIYRAGLLLLAATTASACSDLYESAPQLQHELILSVILIGGNKHSLHAVLNEPLQRTFELCVRLGVLELEEIQVLALGVVVESIEAVVVAAKGDLIERLLARYRMLLLQREQAEIVFTDASERRSEVREGLVDLSLANPLWSLEELGF